MSARLPILAAALLLAVACGAPPRSPIETVRLYLDLLPRDPVRTLELLSDDFHRQHGLRFAEVGDQPFRADDGSDRAAPSRPEDPDLELTRARFGWLTALTKRVFALQAHRFSHELGPPEVDGDRARVPIRVAERGRPPLDATFALARGADGRWRIAAIERGEVADPDLIRAFVLAPDAELNRRILASRSRRGAGGSRP